MSKADYVRSQKQTRDLTCHWPDCEVQVAPALWGCRKHWFTLPKQLQNEIWEAYVPGQEILGNPSAAYIRAAQRVQRWIKRYLEERGHE
jgi:hypothetical protein